MEIQVQVLKVCMNRGLPQEFHRHCYRGIALLELSFPARCNKEEILRMKILIE